MGFTLRPCPARSDAPPHPPRRGINHLVPGRTPDRARALRGLPGRRAGRAVEQGRELGRRAAAAATSSIVPTSTLTMCRMKVSASIQNSSSVAVCRPIARLARPARNARGRSVSGVKAVKSCAPGMRRHRRARASSSTGCGHHSARPRSNGLGAAPRQHPVAVGPRRASRRASKPAAPPRREHRHVARQHAVQRAQQPRRAPAPSGPVEARDLAPAHARPRPCARPRTARAAPVTVIAAPPPAPLDRAQARLRGPAREPAPVVLEREL